MNTRYLFTIYQILCIFKKFRVETANFCVFFGKSYKAILQVSEVTKSKRTLFQVRVLYVSNLANKSA